MNNYFYGIRGIRFVWHGAWADPELIWHRKSFNYYDVENSLWELFQEDCRENERPINENAFPVWVKKNAGLAREILSALLEGGYFYESM